MRFIAGLIALAGLAGLVALLAPVDGPAVLPRMFKGDGEAKIKAIVLVGAFGLAFVVGLAALRKRYMPSLHPVFTLVGFLAAGVIIEAWRYVKIMSKGDNLPGYAAILSVAIVVGLIASLAGAVKARR